MSEEEKKSISKKDAVKKVYGSLGFALIFVGLIVVSLVSKANFSININWSKWILIGAGIFLLVNKGTRKWAIWGAVIYFAITHGVISRILSGFPWKLVIYGLLAWVAIKLISPKKPAKKEA